METNPANRPPQALVEEFRGVGTSTISDIMDEMGLPCFISGLKPVKEGSILVGSAFTIKEMSAAPGTYSIEEFPISGVIDLAEKGDVLVFDLSAEEISTWGGLASTAAKIKGIEGAVIDGGCRDAGEIKACDFPVFSRYITPVSAKTRIKILAVNVSIQCGEIGVNSGDIIVADQTGVVRVPRENAREILAKAKETQKREEHFADGLRKGNSFGDMQKSTGRL